jgi:hypothetical protein
MSSPAQVRANQANAQLSTGPKSAQGKAQSSANSTKEGFCSKQPVVAPEEDEDFAALRAALIEDTHPEGALEQEYFQRLLTYGWNLRRTRAAESSILATVDLGDEVDSARLLRVARYRRDLERSHDRALRELRQLQTQRAILLQQHDCVIDELSTKTPLADLARITSHTDPYIHFMNSTLQRPPVNLATSREQARRDHSNAVSRNEANQAQLSPDEAAERIFDDRLTPAGLDALMDIYTAPPAVPALAA